MDYEEYLIKMNEITCVLPKEFAHFIESQAYSRGHSAGYDEALSITSGLVYEFKGFYDAFLTRIGDAGIVY